LVSISLDNVSRESVGLSMENQSTDILDLRQQWIALFGTTPPAAFHCDMLVRALAWRAQTKMGGEISAAAKRDLAVITAQLRAKRLSAASASTPLPASTRLSPSTQLVRVWRGATYRVEVTDMGYVWEGKTYGSLSQIARTITGTRWNGLLFFGLRERTRKDVRVVGREPASRTPLPRKTAHG
jgi:hypothetical protein